jgi:hypothetical protein
MKQMSSVVRIVEPLVKHGLYRDTEDALRDMVSDRILREIRHFEGVIRKLEKKHGMDYVQFESYLAERSKRLRRDRSIAQALMREEEDSLEWKCAVEMLQSWLGVRARVA